MWRMRVVHVTGYAYRTPVTASYNEARLTPRSDSRQNVIINRVETTPATRSYRYVDYWGTAVTAFDLHAPHTELQVTSSSVVETDKPEPPVASVNWAGLDSSAVLDRFHEVLVPTAYTPFSKRIERTARSLAKAHDPHEAVLATAQWVHNELRYVPGTTGVHSSGLDALAESNGVCQDFAHVMLAMCRSQGIPARYASGYFFNENRQSDEIEASHAWVEIFLPGYGWKGYDPTHCRLVDTRYIKLAVGRDYADIRPVNGTFRGRGTLSMTVEVRITREPSP